MKRIMIKTLTTLVALNLICSSTDARAESQPSAAARALAQNVVTTAGIWNLPIETSNLPRSTRLENRIINLLRSFDTSRMRMLSITELHTSANYIIPIISPTAYAAAGFSPTEVNAVLNLVRQQDPCLNRMVTSIQAQQADQTQPLALQVAERLIRLLDDESIYDAIMSIQTNLSPTETAIWRSQIRSFLAREVLSSPQIFFQQVVRYEGSHRIIYTRLASHRFGSFSMRGIQGSAIPTGCESYSADLDAAIQAYRARAIGYLQGLVQFALANRPTARKVFYQYSPDPVPQTTQGAM